MSDMDNRQDFFHNIESRHDEVFRDCFEGLQFNGWGSSGPEFHAYL
jgi:hypothetical protein